MPRGDSGARRVRYQRVASPRIKATAAIYTTLPASIPRPRIVRAAGSSRGTFEASGACRMGAKVIQVRSVGLAMREKMPRVLTAFATCRGPNRPNWGKRIGNQRHRGYRADRNEARSSRCPAYRRPAWFRQRRDRGRRRIQFEMMPCGDGGNGASDLTSRARACWRRRGVSNRSRNSSGSSGSYQRSVAKVSMVGVGIARTRSSLRPCSGRWPSGA